jgi:hypothetical protein
MKTFSHSTKTKAQSTSRGVVRQYAPQVPCGIANKTGRNQPHTGALVVDFVGAHWMHWLKNISAYVRRDAKPLA